MADFDEDDSPILDIDKEGGSTADEDKKVEEHLSLQPGFDGRKVWLVKVSSFLLPRMYECMRYSLKLTLMDLNQVPKFLQERWNEQKEAGVHLATMRVYHP